MKRASMFRIFLRAFRNRCLNCGKGKPFRRWITMLPACPECGFRLEQDESGFFLGATYINYGFSAVILLGGSFFLWGAFDLMFVPQLAWLIPSAILLPLWFFGRSRLLWLAFVDPGHLTEKRRKPDPPDADRDLRLAQNVLWVSIGLAIVIGLILILQR